jgi:hypothetical protein
MTGRSALKCRLWMVGPRQARAVATRLAGKEIEWCYFGTDIAPRSKVAGILGSANSVSISEELNRVAYDAKQPFLDWIAEIGSRQKDRLNWWASRIASKSPLQTDFFLLICYHKLFQSWVAQGPRSRTRMVVVEDPWLRSLLQRDFAPSGAAFADSKFDRLIDAAYWLARIPLVVMSFILLNSWRRLVASLVLSGGHRIGKQPNPKKLEILLYTWIEESCFASSGRLSDSYTGRLEEILNKNGEAVRRMTPLSVHNKFLWRLRSFAGELLMTPHFITMGDIIRSTFSFFRISNRRALPSLEGSRYTSLFFREILHEWGRGGFATCQLSYRAFRRLAKHCRRRAKVLIYPFENQPWEKMLCMAFNEEAPGIRLIGYQHASVPSLLLSYFLGTQESSHVPLPDVIVTNGRATLDLLKAAGFPAERLIDGGAFRFEYLFDRKETRALSGMERKGQFRILVAFPISRPHAVSLLRDLLELFPTPFLEDGNARQAAFILKFHPDLRWEMLGGQARSLPEWFTVSTHPLRDLMETVDVFLYTPPTGTWREAYCAGLPVLKYQGEFLDIDSTDFDGLGVEGLSVCSMETLRRKVTELSVSSREARKAIVHEVFSPVREEAWLQLVQDHRA